MNSRISSFLPAAAALLLALAQWPGAARAQQQAPVPAVDTASRDEVIRFYRAYYLPSNSVPDVFTGDVATGAAGTVSDAFLSAALQRVNYYRAMSGLPGNITFTAALDRECQQCALMSAAQSDISHDPPSTWKFYTAAAALAAANSDLILDTLSLNEGPGAVDRFINDGYAGDEAVGHRRWLLYANQLAMGMGSVPFSSTNPGSAAIWVLGPFGSRPSTAPQYTSWPPQGYVPADLLYARWSFSYPNADLSSATVSVEKNGVPMAVNREPVQYQGQVGDNTLVWELPDNVVSPLNDESYTVHIANAIVAGAPHAFDYSVTSVDAGPVPAAPLPRVKVTALKPVASASGKSGAFLITRKGDDSAPLSVAYSVGGTADPGDYGSLGTGTVIPAGQSSLKLKVKPLPGANLAGDVTVTLTLQAGSYKVRKHASYATVTITGAP